MQLNLGSSGQFAQQIRQGLPVDLFMAADEDFVFQLADAGLTQDRGVIYALGRIALLVPAASPIALDPGLRGLRDALPGLRHFAIANPEHAPYGRAARQALERLGLWAIVQPKLVLGREHRPGHPVRHQRRGAGRHHARCRWHWRRRWRG